MKMSRIESGVRAALQFYEALNNHDISAMSAVLHDDIILASAYPAPDGALYKGKEEVSDYWQDFFRTHPRCQIDLEELAGMSNRCLARWKYTWLDHSGQEHHLRGVDILRTSLGLLTEILIYSKG